MKIMVKGGSNLTDNEEKYMIQNNSEIEQDFNDDRAEKILSRKKRKLSGLKRLQVLIAAFCSLAVMIGLPVYAWFSYQKHVAELQRIREPDLLYITAANAEDVKFFDLSAIKVEDAEGNAITEPEYYPFAVAGKYVHSFTLQMAHTTNNPFIYKIYEGVAYASEDDANTAAGADGVVVEYKLNGEWDTLEENGVIFTGEPVPVEKSSSQTSVFIVKGEELDSTKYGGGHYLNEKTEDSRHLATNTYHEKSYNGYNYLVRFEEPLYWQCTGIPSLPDNSEYVGRPFFKTFILEISWNAADVTAGRIANDKETDIVYLYAFRK